MSEMIFGNIAQAEDILACVPEPLKAAIKHLQNTDFTKLAAGPYDLQGKDIYVQVIDMETKAEEAAKPEVHRKYIDVQYSPQGREIIGFARDTGRNRVAEDLLENRDLLFYEQLENESRLVMLPGSFAIFFPEDVHRPGIQCGEKAAIRKIVIKVKLDMIKQAGGVLV